MSFLRSLCLVALVAVAGCSQRPAKPAEAAAKPEPTKTLVEQPVTKCGGQGKSCSTVYVNEKWSIDLQDNSLWEKRDIKGTDNLTVDANWISTVKFGKRHVVLTVLSTQVGVGLSPVEFIKTFLAEQDKNDSFKIFTVRKVALESGEVAGLATVGRRTPHGDLADIELISSHGNDGFLVTCGAALDDNSEWAEVCLDVMSTFKIK